MIKSLAIHNFQSHEKSYLKFHPGVNVIVGSSDSGKTAIIRALRWIVWNRPSGDAIRSYWGGDTFAILETEDGFVWRHKGKIDKYELKAYDKNSLVFKAFGTSVPEEISKFLNINEINLQQQLDAPFLLNETPGDVAKHFNKVARLDKIDISLQNINSAIRELTTEIKYREQAIKDKAEELTQFDHLEKAEADLEVLEDMQKQFIILNNSRGNLNNAIIDHGLIVEEIEEAGKILYYEVPVNKILSNIAEQEVLTEQANKLEDLIKEIKEVKQELIQACCCTIQEIPVLNILAIYKERNLVVERHKPLSKLLSNITGIVVALKREQGLQAKLQAKFNNEFPNVCPLCGKPK
jgi:AAA15 family ATPase/GTPase